MTLFLSSRTTSKTKLTLHVENVIDETVNVTAAELRNKMTVTRIEHLPMTLKKQFHFPIQY